MLHLVYPASDQQLCRGSKSQDSKPSGITQTWARKFHLLCGVVIAHNISLER
jgi:hypothetical protein